MNVRVITWEESKSSAKRTKTKKWVFKSENRERGWSDRNFHKMKKGKGLKQPMSGGDNAAPAIPLFFYLMYLKQSLI